MEESKVDYSLRLQEAAPGSIDHGSPTEPTNINGEESIEATKPTYDASPVLLSFIWFGMFLLAIAVSLAGQTIVSYQPYALSEFNAHSMLSVIGTIQYILCVQPPGWLSRDTTTDKLDMQLLSQH
jgi:hypothetical protein